MYRTENRISWYSSLLIAILLNSPRLMALRENTVAAQYWRFNLAEWSFQVIYNLLFCWLVFYLNLENKSRLAIYRNQKRYMVYVLYNALIGFLCIVAGTFIQRICFDSQAPRGMVGSGYIIRLVLSISLVSIVLKIIFLLREREKQELENQQLKSSYLVAELELLKEQMNPHFLFNSLSILSAVIREDAGLAQKYLKELSNVLRYAITQSKVSLVTVERELAMLHSFAHLISMRLEDAFKLDIQVPEQWWLYQLPHMSLQPLLENAVKHNAATAEKPLTVVIGIQENYLVISNSLRELPQPEHSNGIGLANLNERFRIMMQQEIEIVKTSRQFIVKLPLKYE
jgi:two-component system LytT family sensor kinase